MTDQDDAINYRPMHWKEAGFIQMRRLRVTASSLQTIVDISDELRDSNMMRLSNLCVTGKSAPASKQHWTNCVPSSDVNTFHD
jgi:hypothetical protein